MRICPYCQNSIPNDEDPCHHCGRLEPAEPRIKPSRQVNNCLEIAFLVLVFALGLAMIIWPKTAIPDISTCGPDGEIACFIETYWGVAGGIYLMILAFACASLVLLTRFINRKQR